MKNLLLILCLCCWMPAWAISDEQFVAEALLTIQTVQAANGSADNPAKGNQALWDKNGTLYQHAMTRDIEKAAPLTRVVAAHWLFLRSQNIDNGYSPTPPSFLQTKTTQHDLLRAWQLITNLSLQQDQRVVATLRMQVAWGLRDLNKIRMSYSEFCISAAPDREESVYCMAAAAHLGEWTTMQKYAKSAKANGMHLQDFHDKANEDIFSFDYESVQNAVIQGKPKAPDANPSSGEYVIKKRRVRLKSVTSSDPDQIRKFKEKIPDGWQDVKDWGTTFIKIGVAVQWLENSDQPVVAGFWSDNRIFMTGYRETFTDRLNYTWDMRPDPVRPNLWRGSSSRMHLHTDDDTEPKPVGEVIFDEEWEMAKGGG